MRLSKSDLIEVNRIMIESYGGAKGVLSGSTLDYAIYKAQKAKDFVDEAATLFEIIAQEHPFVDGNKRTAFAAAEMTLLLNGHSVSANNQDIIDFVLKVARRELTHRQIVRWVKDRLKEQENY